MQIVTDSAADMPESEARQLGVTVAPLYIHFPEGQVTSSELTPDEFYQRLLAMEPEIPTTSQPSAAALADLYRSVEPATDEVLSIHISSGLSGTINSARLAAAELAGRAVHIVDSLTLSGGLRFQVLAAARAARAGWPLERIREHLDRLRAATEVVYTLDTLKYLARGGRIGRVQALAGSLLNLKPIIRVERADGKYSTVGKARTLPRALSEIAGHLQAMYSGGAPVWVSVLHGQFAEPARQLADLLKSALPVGRMEVLRISPVLGVHTGPGIVGATVAPLELVEPGV